MVDNSVISPLLPEILHFVQDDILNRVILSPSLSVMLSEAKHLSFTLRTGSAKNLDPYSV